MTVLVTYGLQHAPFMAILSSNALDLVLLLGVIGVMVWHTLKYDSQLVTGASFLLGFAAITLNPDPPYNLLAGAMLVTGMTLIVLRRRWFELEIFGILASYLNHFYWLYSIFNLQETRAPFPHHTVSMLLMIAYWVVFRCSYVWRKVETHEEESVSTIAGLLNPLLFLAVMKYQSFHPEWAFYALLGMGASEFIFGQLPVSRRRVAPFRVLSSLGAALMVAAVPFKYSGNSMEMLWLAGAEAFLLAGIFVRERLFRGFGLIISSLVALYVMVTRITPLLQEVLNAQPHHHAQLGIGLAVIAAVLYANANIIGRRWHDLFKEELERQSLRTLSFAASAFAVCAVYALVSDNAVAILLALLVFLLCVLGKQFSIGDLTYQAHWIAVVAFVQTIVAGQTLETSWHGVPGRVLMFVPVAGPLYLSSRYVRLSETSNNEVFSPAYSWAATSLLASPDLVPIARLEHDPALDWFGVSALACGRCAQARRLEVAVTCIGTALIGFCAPHQSCTDNTLLPSSNVSFHFRQPYRCRNLSAGSLGAACRDPANLHVRRNGSLLTVLAYQEAPAPWIPAAWISLALVLGFAARLRTDRALLWQTHALSLLAAGWTLYASFAPQYRGTMVQLISVALTGWFALPAELDHRHRGDYRRLRIFPWRIHGLAHFR